MKLSPRAYADALVVAPSGRLDHESCEAFRAGLQPHLDAALAGAQSVILDLSGLEYISSAGLRCFMLAARQADAQGGRILVAAPRPVVAEILQISRFNLVFRVLPSLREALLAVSPAAAAAFDRA
jgi:anti-sigma B factor antagonist